MTLFLIFSLFQTLEVFSAEDCGGQEDKIRNIITKTNETRLSSIEEIFEQEREISLLLKSCSLDKKNKLKQAFDYNYEFRLREHVEKLGRNISKSINYIAVEKELQDYDSVISKLENNNVPKSYYKDSILTPSQRSELISKRNEYIHNRQNSCKPVDNRRYPLIEKNSSKDNMRNQLDKGWCYAFSTADMISHKLGEAVSAIEIATLYNKENYGTKVQKNFLGEEIKSINPNYFLEESGLTHEALAIAKENICIYDNIPAEEVVAYENDSATILSFFEEVEQFLTHRNPYEFYRCKVEQGEASELLNDNVISNESFYDLLKVATSIGDFSLGLLQASCKKKQVDFDINYYLLRDYNISDLDEVLSRGDIAGLDFNSKIFIDPSRTYQEFNHAVTIVGRRFNEKTKVCEYLIRNSWGKSCENYHESYECADGNIWLAEDRLLNSHPTITELKEK